MKAKYGIKGPAENRSSILWFDLVPTEFYALWKGRLIVEWPPPEIVLVAPVASKYDASLLDCRGKQAGSPNAGVA